MARGAFDGVEVRLKVINSPVKFSQTPATIRSLAPELGQHTEETLLELGYTWDDMAEFKNQGVIM
jgi:crotonobetainyl-CoA:carnitine CoA-transferase CaiB-like acyl-CoA transferase